MAPLRLAGQPAGSSGVADEIEQARARLRGDRPISATERPTLPVPAGLTAQTRPGAAPPDDAARLGAIVLAAHREIAAIRREHEQVVAMLRGEDPGAVGLTGPSSDRVDLRAAERLLQESLRQHIEALRRAFLVDVERLRPPPAEPAPVIRPGVHVARPAVLTSSRPPVAALPVASEADDDLVAELNGLDHYDLLDDDLGLHRRELVDVVDLGPDPSAVVSRQVPAEHRPIVVAPVTNVRLDGFARERAVDQALAAADAPVSAMAAQADGAIPPALDPDLGPAVADPLFDDLAAADLGLDELDTLEHELALVDAKPVAGRRASTPPAAFVPTGPPATPAAWVGNEGVQGYTTAPIAWGTMPPGQPGQPVDGQPTFVAWPPHLLSPQVLPSQLAPAPAVAEPEVPWRDRLLHIDVVLPVIAVVVVVFILLAWVG